MEQEEWRPIEGFTGYAVSDLGRVVSHKRKNPRVLTGVTREWGHVAVHLWIDGRQQDVFVHRLVAEAFIGPRPDGMEVRHLNGDPSDNTVGNLGYGTPSQNVLDSVGHGTHKEARKTACSNGHPLEEGNVYRPPSRPTWRMCKACNRDRSRVRREARRAA